MKFDFENWNMQKTLIGLPIMTTKGMFVNVKIYDKSFEFYALEPISSIIIDAKDKMSLVNFKKYSYAIRLAFAFLSGKFYKDEVVYISSKDKNFTSIEDYEYNLENPSIITNSQIINPTFFFQTFKNRTEKEQKELKDYHKMFSSQIFSKLCEEILKSSEILRTIELIVSASSLSDTIQKGALYSVAVETITEFLKEKTENAFKPIEDKSLWKKFRLSQIQNLDTFKEEISKKSYSVLKSKIDNINTPTNRDKLVKPFNLFGINLSDDDLKTLDNRNKYLHGKVPIETDWNIELEINAYKLHNLLSILILKMIKYKGHCINLSSLHMMQSEDAQELIKNMNLIEIQKVTDKIKNENLKKEEISDAIEKMEEFQKLLKSIKEIENIIQII